MKYRVSLPYTERVFEVDDEDEACQRFRDDETVFYDLETELLNEEPNALDL